MRARAWGPLFALAALTWAAALAAQDRTAVPSFKGEAAVMTVDLVVLGPDGRPLRGLKKEDVTILEDGRPQPLVGFEPRELGPPPAAEAQAAQAVGLPQAAADEAPGRTLAFVIDDLGLDATSHQALDDIRRWLAEKADPRDALTLVTTSGEVEWTGRVGSGRGEALRALGRIRPRRPQPSFFTVVDPEDPQPPPMTEWKAYQIASGRQEASAPQRNTAISIFDWWQGRVRSIVTAVEGFSREHASLRGRKPIFVFTQGLIREDDLKLDALAIDASQRANTPVYFVDTRGLVARGEVATARRVPSADLERKYGDVTREAAQHVDTAGAEQIAVETGGAMLRDSNDFLGDLTRAVDESSSYYLVGYQPATLPDGHWHKVEVKVAVKGATVRARRGYYASPVSLADQAAPAPKRDAAAPSPATAEARPQGSAPAPAAVSADSVPPASSPKLPTFSASAEAITVDVVVLDKEGHPVTDLKRDDFTLSEDGRGQEIVGFETRALAREAAEPEAAAAPFGAASNEHPPAPTGRTIAFLIDDLGIEPTHMGAVAKALSSWLDDGARRNDSVTLVTSSGDAWWSDTALEGRADLEAVLRRLKGKKAPAGAGDSMSDYEAYAVDSLGSPLETVENVIPTGPPGTGPNDCTKATPSASMRERVVDRWFRTNACACDTASPDTIEQSLRSCRGAVTARARQVYENARVRAVGLLGTMERLSTGLSGARGRKSIVVLSEGLLRDTDQRAYERAVDASRRGNTALSFIDVRGLIAMPVYGADQRQPAKGGDIGSMTAETTLLETAGGDYLAETTGGSTVRNTNDIGGSVKRLADESAAYYLLGYQSDRPLDGKWRKLTVKVARPGLTIRARRGFFATSTAPVLTVEKEKKKEKRKDGTLPPRAIDPALAVGGDRDQVPLRLAAHVLETDAAGNARVLVAMEVGTAALSFTGTGAERTAQLDVTVLGVSRDRAKTVPVDSHVALGVDARAVGGWYVFSRELRLPPGPAQIRALVRDTATGRSGLLTQRIVVPPSDHPYLSTPVLSDRVMPAQGLGEPRMVVAAHRTFAPRGRLLCVYEVYVAPGKELQQMPHVVGSYRLEDAEGRQVAAEDPTPIAMGLDARLSRTIGLPLDHLTPGRYRLTVEAADKASGLSLQAEQVFFVEPPAQAAGPETPARPN